MKPASVVADEMFPDGVTSYMDIDEVLVFTLKYFVNYLFFIMPMSFCKFIVVTPSHHRHCRLLSNVEICDIFNSTNRRKLNIITY